MQILKNGDRIAVDGGWVTDNPHAWNENTFSLESQGVESTITLLTEAVELSSVSI
jgi:hypothetical protein